MNLVDVEDLRMLRIAGYKLEGSYEDSYNYLMEGLDDLIKKGKEGVK